MSNDIGDIIAGQYDGSLVGTGRCAVVTHYQGHSLAGELNLAIQQGELTRQAADYITSGGKIPMDQAFQTNVVSAAVQGLYGSLGIEIETYGVAPMSMLNSVSYVINQIRNGGVPEPADRDYALGYLDIAQDIIHEVYTKLEAKITAERPV